MVDNIVLNKVGITVVLNRLARDSSDQARSLYGRLMSSWGHRPDRQRVTIKVGDSDLRLLRNLDLPGGVLGFDVVPSGWCVLYRHPRNSNLEVRVTTKKRPPRKRTFRIGGKRVRLVAVKATRIKHATNNNHKEAVQMARAKTKKRKDEDELDELEGLEDLDDLEDLEDEDEPDDEVDEDEEDEEDEEPAPKRSRSKKAPAKGKAKGKTSRSRKAVEEDEDEDEDEEEEPAPKKRSGKAKASTKKSTTKTKAKSNGKGNLPATRELPKGKLGPQDIAEMVDGECDARYVRIFLRESEDWEREEGGRWAFSKTEAKQLVKEIKARRRGD